MKKFYVLLLILINGGFAMAQGKVDVTGQVKDPETKRSLEFCSVAVLNAKDSLISGGVTDQDGFFSIALNPDVYRFVFSFIGYKTDTTTITAVYENVFLGVIKLEPTAKTLSGVSVSENSAENQLDRDVQIVTDKLRMGAASTKDVLNKINGVTYDRYSNSIKVDNDAKVIILVDGIEKDQEYIKNLSPDRLKKVEIIRDPGGRYALEGYSAVINIILKKDYQGTELFLYDELMADPDALKTEYIPAQNNVSGTLNYVYNKVNIYGKYSNNITHFNLQSFVKQEYASGFTVDKGPSNDKDMNLNIKQLYHNYTLGADYYINPKHTISFEGNLSTQPMDQNKTNEHYNVTYMESIGIPYQFASESINKSKTTSSYGSLFYQGKLDENNLINSNFTFSNYQNHSFNIYNEISIDSRTEEETDAKNSTEFFLEYTHNFKNKTNLQVGYGNSWQKLNSNYLVESVNTPFSFSDFRNKLYAYFSWQKSKKFGIKFGGVAETSSPNADGQKKSYIIFQPYADIKYAPGKSIDFKLKYRSASGYPNISQTNPFSTVIDVHSIRTGNPHLKPEVTHKISLQMDILGGMLTLEPYYHFSNNYITETGNLRPDNIFEYTYSNAGSYRKCGVEARFSVPIAKVFFLQAGADLFSSSIKFDGKTNQVNDWSMSGDFIYQNQKVFTMAGFQYQKNMTKSITAQGYSKDDVDFWIVFLQQPFFKQRLSVMLLYFTPLKWGVDQYQGSYIKTDNYTETRKYDVSILKNFLMLEISYRFNKGKSVTKTEKNIELKKEKDTKGVF
jgi:hypothetical protein